jgi:hypothetical protein
LEKEKEELEGEGEGDSRPLLRDRRIADLEEGGEGETEKAAEGGAGAACAGGEAGE